MIDFLNLSSQSSVCQRIEFIQDIHKYLFSSPENINRTQLHDCASAIDHVVNVQKSRFFTSSEQIDWNELVNREDASNYIHTYYLLKQMILYQKDVLIKTILNSGIMLYR